MSYTIENLTSIDDAIFDMLWDASFARIESGGTMPWSKYEVHYGHDLTDAEKKEILKLVFTQASSGGDNNKLWLTRKDGIPVRMMNYEFNPEEGIVHGSYQLIGPDAVGSRAWLFDQVLLRQTRDRFISEFGATGHTGMVITGSSIHNYYISRDPGDGFSLTETQANGISTITFTYTD